MINHWNLANDDGQVYCCLRNRVVQLDEKHSLDYCSGCRMWAGDAGGRGIECVWDDMREEGGGTFVVIVENPEREWLENQTETVATEYSLTSSWSVASEYEWMSLDLGEGASA